jgi:hypothetical protein
LPRAAISLGLGSIIPVHQARSGSTSVTGHAASHAFDALCLAKSRVRPMDGNVFGPTLQVWASVVVRVRLAHGRTLAESRYLRTFH